MKKAPAGWYPIPEKNDLGYWDGEKWLDIPLPPKQKISENKNKPTSSFAVASFVMSFIFFPLAIVFGHIAIAEIRKSNGNLQGQALAIAGLVIGYLWILLVFIFLLAGGSFTESFNQEIY